MTIPLVKLFYKKKNRKKNDEKKKIIKKEKKVKKKIVLQLKPKLSHSIMCSRYTAE